MADDEIRVRLTVDGKEAELSLEQFKSRLTGLGGETEKGSAALKGFSFATKEAAHELGVGGPMARLFGHEAMGMAEGLGTAGVAFGALGIAALTAYKIYEHFAEEQKKAYEETMKQADAAAALITGLIDESSYTDSLTRSIRNLNEQKRILAERDLNEGIEATRKKVLDLTDTIKAGGDWWDRLREFSLGLSTDQAGYLNTITGYTKSYNKELERTLIHLNELVIARERNETGFSKGSPEVEQAKMDLEIRAALYKDNQKMLEDDKSLRLAIQAAIYKDNQDMLVKAKKDQEDYNVASAMMTQQRIKWDQEEAQLKQQSLYNTASFMSSSFQAMYQAGGAHARKSFSLFKLAASAEALMNADRAAASAFAWGTQLGGPPLGFALAALALAAGMARVKSIRAMTLEGGGGAGGSVPTYSVSPTTGEPSATGGGSVNLTLVINGQTQNIGALTEGVIMELDRNNGTIGGISISMERSA